MKHYAHSSEDVEQSRAAKVRFKQQIFASVGGGMIFALVGVVTAKLLSMGAATTATTAAATATTATAAAATAGSMVLPVLGIAAVGLIGLGCVYMAAKYLSKAVSLDQETQAEKISQATQGRGPVIAQAPTLQPTKPINVPAGGALGAEDKAAEEVQLSNIPGTTVSDLAYHQKMAASHGEKITLH